MYNRVAIFLLCSIMVLLSNVPAEAAWPWKSRQDLVMINGVAYTTDDYLHWRENWSGKGENPGHDIESFIEWKLLVQEGMNMELDQSPAVRRKNEIFLRVNERLQFKLETVDSKIQITEQDLRERFEKDYNPVAVLTFLYFRSDEKAQEARKKIEDNISSFDDLKDTPEDEGGPHQNRQKTYYPYELANNPNLKEAVDALGAGEPSSVYPMGNLSVMMRLERREAPGEGLYSEKKNDIYNRLAKEQSSRFTAELIKSLWEKYEVEVDEELFATVSPEMARDILNKPIARTNEADIPLFLLVKDIRAEHTFRRIEDWPADKRVELYRGLLNGMIIEYLFTWESSTRNYEEKPPFKWTYAYQKEKNLIKEIESQLLDPRVSLSEDEIKRYYQLHADDYKDEDKYSFLGLDGEQELVGRIWQEISRGGDFTEVANKYQVKMSAQRDIVPGLLSPGIGTMLQMLDKDEVSQPFAVENGRYALVKLLDRKIGMVKPLESVREIIVEKLRPGKFQQVREEYIKKLYEFSEIDVNREAWEKLVADQSK